MRVPIKLNIKKEENFILDIPAGMEIRLLATGMHLQMSTAFFSYLKNHL